MMEPVGNPASAPGEVWSSGTWQVKAGGEDAFVEAWLAFARWSEATHGPARAWLLRDRDVAGRFVSIGPWPSDAAIEAWRADPGFRERVGVIRSLVDAFEPSTLDPVAAVPG